MDDRIDMKCENCRFFAEAEQQCRRRSPVFYHVSAQLFSGFPNTGAGDWCGEFIQNLARAKGAK